MSNDRIASSASSFRRARAVVDLPGRRRRIRDPTASAYDCKGAQRSGLTVVRGEDVHHRHTVCEHVVGNDATMAAPPDGLGTQDRARLARRHLEQLPQAFTKRGGRGVVGVIVEGASFPARVHAVFDALAPGAPSAERREMDIGDPCAVEHRRQHVEVELRIGPRSRETSDIDESAHPERAENVDELTCRTRRMSDRKESARARPPPGDPGGPNGPLCRRAVRGPRVPHSSLGHRGSCPHCFWKREGARFAPRERSRGAGRSRGRDRRGQGLAGPIVRGVMLRQ
jgi:hypothetical protein